MNPLDPIIDWHRTAQDALRVTLRVINQGAGGIVTSRHVFHAMPQDDCFDRVRMASDQLDNFTVLALVAVFERLLRDHVLSIVQNRFAATNSIETRIMACVENDAEFWNFTGRLIDVFDTVHSDVRGRVKQFVDFRNWLAHARHAGTLPQAAPLVLTPRDVHQVLTTFLQQAGLL